MATDLHIYADLKKDTINLVGTENDIDLMILAIQDNFYCESIKREYPERKDSLHQAYIKVRGTRKE